MSDLFVPFNFQPLSVSVKSSSYTIPAGNYALVTVVVEHDGGAASFTIDTVSAIQVMTAGNIATASFWLPSGTVINGSGDWVATVQLYTNIT